MGLRGLTVIALFLFPVACGGRVIEENTPDNSTTPTDMNSSPDASTPSKNSSGSGSTKDDFNGMVALPSCVMGKRVSDVDPSSLAKGCPYVYSGRCYTTKVKACACACPNKPNTVCSSGFPSSEGTTEVFCG